MASVLTLIFVSARLLLEENGYSLTLEGQGFRLVKKGKEETVDCGFYSAILLNLLLHDAGVEGFEPFPIGFRVGSTAKGKLSADAVNLPTNGEESDYEKDVLAAGIFASTEVVPHDGGLSGSRTAYVYRRATLSHSHEYMLFDPDLDVPNITLGVDGKPFYKAISLKSFLKAPEVIPPRVWAKHIEENGYYWNMEAGVLYVTNILSGKHSIPPNHVALGLSLEIDAANKPTTTDEDLGAVPPGRSMMTTVDSSGSQWLPAFRQFARNPCKATSDVLRSHALQKEYKAMKGTTAYNWRSSRQNKASSRIAADFTGPRQAKTYKAYYEKIVDEMGDFEQAQFVVFMKLEGQMKSSPVQGSEDLFYLNATV